MRKLFILSVLLFIICAVNAQKALEITIISDATEQENHLFEELIKTEITALLASRFDLRFTEIYTDGTVSDVTNEIENSYAKDEADVLIGAGILSSKILAERNNYPIPTIASIQLVDENDINASSSRTSGISNYTYIKSPFNVEDGVEVLKEICRCDKLAVFTDSNISEVGMTVQDIYSGNDVEIDWLIPKADINNTINQINDDVKGVYVLSSFDYYSSEEIRTFFDELNKLGLPSFSLFDSPMLELGAYAAFAASDNIKKIPRRIALNIEKITEGQDPKDFPVEMEAFTNQLVVNMETVNKTGKYPNWTLLDNALLININKYYTSRVISLTSAIAEGIQNNLGYQIETKQSQISAKDLSLARSNYLPQLDVETTGLFLDENTVNNSFGTRGRFNWTAGASFSQLILAEPALANIAIQKLLFERQLQTQNQSELDVILEVAQRYFTYQQVLSLAELQNNNITAINQNLAIATNKEQAGYSGASDVYRWKTELELAKTDLYATNAQLKAARFQLNETLNRPIDEEFIVEKSESIGQFLKELDEVFVNLIEDQSSLKKLADFMVDEAMQNLPELQQVELAIAAQERLLKSNKRAFYLPTLAFGANYEYPIENVNTAEPLPIPGLVPGDNPPTWNAAFNLSIPLFAGGSRKYEKERTEVGLYQLQDQQKDLTNLLELQVRANVELVNASYNNIRLTKSAAEAAAKNIVIVQDLYKSGQINVITLVDAQNSLLGAQINATNAAYQFMIDYFALQRSTGYYLFLGTDEQQASFLQRFINYKTN